MTRGTVLVVMYVLVMEVISTQLRVTVMLDETTLEIKGAVAAIKKAGRVS